MRAVVAGSSVTCLLAALLAMPGTATAAAGSVDAVVLVDDGVPGSTVANGLTSVYDDTAADTVTAAPVSVGSAGLSFTLQHSGSSAVSLVVVPKTGTKFVAGTSYPFTISPSATQAELQSPALCSGLAGTLAVDDVAYTSTTITSLTARFTGTCSNQHRGSGEIRWHSTQTYAAASASYGTTTVGTGASTTFDITVTARGTADVHTGAFTAPTGTLGSLLSFDASDCTSRTLAAGATCVIHVTATGGASPTVGFGSAQLAADVAAGDIWLPLNITVVNQPLAPTGLMLLAAVDGSRVVWSGGSGTTYELQRSTNGGAFADVATGVGLNSWADTDTAAGTPVAYRVRVLQGSAQGSWATLTTTSPARTDAGSGSADVVALTALDADHGSANALHTSGITAATDSVWSASLTYGSTAVSFATRDPLTPGTYQTSDGSLRSLSIGSCGGQGSVVVRAFAIHADGTLATLDADEDVAACGHFSVALRWNSNTTYSAVTTSPSTVDGGTLSSGQSSAAHTVKVFNQGASSVTLGSATLTGSVESSVGDSMAGWQVSNDHCAGTTLAAGGSCAVTLTFAPTAPGKENGSLTYAITGGSTLTGFTLTGAGIAPPAAPTLSLQVQPGQIGVTVTPSTDDGGSPVTALHVYAGPDAGSLVHLTDVTNGQTYWITGLHAGDHRTIAATAVNASGESTQATSEAVVPSQALVYAATGTQTAPPVTGAIELRAGTQDGQPTERAVASGIWCDASTPAVSPDRTLVAYVHDDCVSSTLTLAPTGATGSVQQLGGVPDSSGWLEDPAFSPDGKTLASVSCSTSACGVGTAPIAAGGVTMGNVTGLPSGGSLERPVWTADGKSLIATSISGSARSLVRWPVAGGAATTIAGTSGAMQAALSPDGTTLAFTHLDTATSTAFTSSLWTVPLAGGTPTQVHTPTGEITYPAWAADGTGILYDRYASGHSHVYETSDGVASLVATRTGWDAWEPAVLTEDTVAPSVTLGFGAWTTGAPSLAFSVSDRTTPLASLTITCSLDGSPYVACATPYAPGALADGAHTLSVRASDPSGNEGLASAGFTVDPTAPTVPTLSLATVFTGSQVAKAASVTIHLAGTDAASGVSGYQIRTRTATLGATLPALGSAASIAASSSRTLSVGHQWCAVGRTVDVAGNTSAWSAEQCLLVPYDDVSFTSSGWTRGTAAGTFAGTASSTSTKGATLTRTGFKGSTVLLVARVCSKCGKLTITVGSTVKTVNLVSSASTHWAVLPVALGAVRTGTLKIAMAATTGKAYVDAVAWS